MHPFHTEILETLLEIIFYLHLVFLFLIQVIDKELYKMRLNTRGHILKWYEQQFSVH